MHEGNAHNLRGNLIAVEVLDLLMNKASILVFRSD